MKRHYSLLLAFCALVACDCATKDTSGMKSTGKSCAVKQYRPPVRQAEKPVAPAVHIVKDEKIVDRVFFGFDKYTLTDQARRILDKQVKWLAQDVSALVLVEGRCDERGTREYNIGLGERRANAVKDYFVSKGIDPNRVHVTSLGKENPVVPGSNPIAWAQNRTAISVPLK